MSEPLLRGETSSAAGDKLLSHRFYESPYPEVEDFVMVEVKRIEEMGAYVVLKEYDDQEGMILLSELSRRRIRSIHKIIRVGRFEVVVVLRVDKEKGYIDVSKRRVTPEDVQRTEERYNKAKAVHLIVSSVAQSLNMPVSEVYPLTAWPLYKVYGHAYDAFKVAVSEPDVIFGDEGPCGMLKVHPRGAEVKDAIIAVIKERMSPKAVKVRADVEVTCNERPGIEAIKTALRAGEATGTTEVPVDVKLIAAPLYVLTATSTDKTVALELVDKAIEAVRASITASGGKLSVKQQPRLVRESDDLELAELMAKLSKKQMLGDENESGSESESESESGSESE